MHVYDNETGGCANAQVYHMAFVVICRLRVLSLVVCGFSACTVVCTTEIYL